MLNNKTYDIIKKVAQVGIPAFATMVGAIGLAYNIDGSEQFVIAITAFGTFLGTLLGVESKKYNTPLDTDDDEIQEDFLQTEVE